MPTESQYRAAAIRKHHVEGELEIDTDALVSLGGDSGAYVQAWIWVSDNELNAGPTTKKKGILKP